MRYCVILQKRTERASISFSHFLYFIAIFLSLFLLRCENVLGYRSSFFIAAFHGSTRQGAKRNKRMEISFYMVDDDDDDYYDGVGTGAGAGWSPSQLSVFLKPAVK